MKHDRWLLCLVAVASAPARVLCQGVAETLVSQGGFSTLLLALEKTGLAAALTGEVTVFAPTDAAFDSLLQSLGASAQDLLGRADLPDILRLHVAKGQIAAESLASGAVVQSLEGARLAVSSEGNNKLIGGARIVQADLAAGSGIVHAIDKVLLPPQRRLLDGGSSGWQQSAWRVTVDGVMGGRSTGKINFAGNTMVFGGNINLNGGGFSSVRRSYSIDLSSYAGVLIEFESSTFKVGKSPLGLHLQLGQSSSSYSYAAAFAVPFSSTSSSERCKVFIPIEGFDRASRWGYDCASCKLDASKVNALEVYALYQSGAFEVRLHSIKIVEKALDAPLPTAPSISIDSGLISSMLQATIDSGGSLYDKGYKGLCVAVYETAARQIVAAAGPSGAIRALACAGLQQAASGTKTRRAWVLRKAFDAILADLAGRDRTLESRYPPSVQGNWLPRRGDMGTPGTCVGLVDLSSSSQASIASASPAPVAAPAPTTESSSNLMGSFLGPFMGMGITGWNNLGSSRVSDPVQCATKCLQIARCKSFDYGARGSVAGECWLSTADRTIAGNDYKAWNLYDYYELSTESATAGSSAASSMNSAASLRGSSSEGGSEAAVSPGGGSSEEPGSLTWMLLGVGVVGGIGLGVAGVCLYYRRVRTPKFAMANNPNDPPIVVGQPVGSYGKHPMTGA